MKKRLLFVVNPSSGTLKIKDSLLEICQIFCDGGYDLTLNVTKYISDAITEALNQDKKYDLIICCGWCCWRAAEGATTDRQKD